MLTRPRHSTKAVLQEFQADGVVHLELRTTPRAIPENAITKDDYVKAVLDVINAWNSSPATSMRAYLILSIDRRNTIAQAEEVVDLCINYQPAGVVGIDLCGDPAKGDVRIFTQPFARAKAAGLKMTLHFAEAKVSATDTELETLLSWKPDRLGHVIHVKEEYCKIIERENIGVELCLSCNVHARMITGTYSDHHFGMWRHANVPVALSVRLVIRNCERCTSNTLQTDDVGVFCSPLSEEYALAAQHFDLTRSDVKSLCVRVVDSIFVGEDEKQRLRTLYSEWDWAA